MPLAARLLARPRELATFYEKLAQLEKAGVPLLESLPLAAMQAGEKGLRADLRAAEAALRGGKSLTEALSGRAAISALDLALISVGEMNGRLDQSLADLAALYEQRRSSLEALLQGLHYPLFLLAFALLVPPIPTWFTTGFLAYAREVLRGASLILVPALCVILPLAVLKRRSPLAMDRLGLSMPVLGGILRRLALSRFSRSLAALVRGGVDLTSGFRLAIRAMGNRLLEKESEAAMAALRKGQALSESLRAARAFPVALVQLVAVGERTGEIDKMLARAADDDEREAERVLRGLVRALPMVVYLLIALRVGAGVIGFYKGYTQQLDAVRDLNGLEGLDQLLR